MISSKKHLAALSAIAVAGALSLSSPAFAQSTPATPAGSATPTTSATPTGSATTPGASASSSAPAETAAASTSPVASSSSTQATSPAPSAPAASTPAASTSSAAPAPKPVVTITAHDRSSISVKVVNCDKPVLGYAPVINGTPDLDQTLGKEGVTELSAPELGAGSFVGVARCDGGPTFVSEAVQKEGKITVNNDVTWNEGDSVKVETSPLQAGDTVSFVSISPAGVRTNLGSSTVAAGERASVNAVLPIESDVWYTVEATSTSGLKWSTQYAYVGTPKDEEGKTSGNTGNATSDPKSTTKVPGGLQTSNDKDGKKSTSKPGSLPKTGSEGQGILPAAAMITTLLAGGALAARKK